MFSVVIIFPINYVLAFIIYGAFVLFLASLLIFLLGPRFGKTTPLIYILISASLGSLSVMACKGLGIAIKVRFSLYWL